MRLPLLPVVKSGHRHRQRRKQQRKRQSRHPLLSELLHGRRDLVTSVSASPVHHQDQVPLEYPLQWQWVRLGRECRALANVTMGGQPEALVAALRDLTETDKDCGSVYQTTSSTM
jgi:hypothetical protein